LSAKNVDFLGKCECRSAKSTTKIAIAAVTRVVCCIGAMCKGALLEVVTGMSNVHSLGDMLINLIIVVERHIVVVECVYVDERGHRTTGFKGRVITIIDRRYGMH
jgi:hypothetical protein